MSPLDGELLAAISRLGAVARVRDDETTSTWLTASARADLRLALWELETRLGVRPAKVAPPCFHEGGLTNE